MASSPGRPRRFADLGTRVASAAVAAVVGLGLLWAGGVWAVLLVALVTGAMIWEVRSVTLHRGGPCGADVALLLAGVAGAAAVAELGSAAAALVWLGGALVVAALADLAAGRREALGRRRRRLCRRGGDRADLPAGARAARAGHGAWCWWWRRPT